jgi:hypothetical protein
VTVGLLMLTGVWTSMVQAMQSWVGGYVLPV